MRPPEQDGLFRSPWPAARRSGGGFAASAALHVLALIALAALQMSVPPPRPEIRLRDPVVLVPPVVEQASQSKTPLAEPRKALPPRQVEAELPPPPREEVLVPPQIAPDPRPVKDLASKRAVETPPPAPEPALREAEVQQAEARPRERREGGQPHRPAGFSEAETADQAGPKERKARAGVFNGVRAESPSGTRTEQGSGLRFRPTGFTRHAYLAGERGGGDGSASRPQIRAAGFGPAEARLDGESKPGTTRVAEAGFGGAAAKAANGAPAKEIAAAGFGTASAAPAGDAPPPAEDREPQRRPARILSKPQPEYTEAARRLGIQGEVWVRVRFTKTGTVEILGVTRRLGHGLGEKAVQAARGIRFEPARVNGRPADSAATVRIIFQLAR